MLNLADLHLLSKKFHIINDCRYNYASMVSMGCCLDPWFGRGEDFGQKIMILLDGKSLLGFFTGQPAS